ncbi:MAG: pyrroline-5-carboxylate reductase, partial [Methylobacterium sp.]|nr:pyrroline-5-carboxylate reductase [Methylobacterium sp.]
MSSSLPTSLVLLGAGKMGGAMLEGWLRIGMNPAGISLFDPHPSD